MILAAPWVPSRWVPCRRKPNRGKARVQVCWSWWKTIRAIRSGAVYTVRFAKAVYVLHCFRKKSPSGIRTSQNDIDLIHERLKVAQRHFKDHYEHKN